ncbi:hypothetical protein E2C01_013953 [Portunus trituberculatus]|uniref:Uncharacterized protein n=1 Tax=Portunus trituberculatus TaxID=210409 RepID=A0A5B7DHK4_PORTR|nr:hypothetical protein [Portunus trituberculatus]
MPAPLPPVPLPSSSRSIQACPHSNTFPRRALHPVPSPCPLFSLSRPISHSPPRSRTLFSPVILSSPRHHVLSLFCHLCPASPVLLTIHSPHPSRPLVISSLRPLRHPTLFLSPSTSLPAPHPLPLTPAPYLVSPSLYSPLDDIASRPYSPSHPSPFWSHSRSHASQPLPALSRSA